MKKHKERLTTLVIILLAHVLLLSMITATPTGPDSVTIQSNETKGDVPASTINVSGGRILTFNLSATIQNVRWKGFLGHISGSFTLDDATGSTIYDWSTTSLTGEVYATRNASTVTWTNVTCATTTNLETENDAMSHTNAEDNITATFNDTTHTEFFLGSTNITTNSCPTMNTYVGNATQDSTFEAVALYEAVGTNVIYATILESDSEGFDSENYDFQMIVPENGAAGFTGSTAYYIYVELS